MKFICVIALSLAFAPPVFAEEPANAPVLPSNIASWQKEQDKSCTTKDKRVIREVVYFREHTGGETATFLIQQSLNEVLVVHGEVLLVSGLGFAGAKMYVQHPKGKWTLYDQKVADDHKKSLNQTWKAFDLTKEEYYDCLDRLK